MNEDDARLMGLLVVVWRDESGNERLRKTHDCKFGF